MATTLVSLDEYLNTSYRPDVDYVDGVLVERNVGTPLHGSLQGIVTAFFLQLIEAYNFAVLPETRLRVNVATNRHRIPDVMLVELPYRAGRVIIDIPAVIVEIKSPDDTLDDLIERFLDYESMHVPNIVLLDPDNRRLYEFRDNALKLVSSMILRFPKSGRELDFQPDILFAKLDRQAGS